MKNIYEILDEFEAAESKKDKMKVIENNLCKALVDVLQLTYHPNFQWLVSEMPEDYRIPSDQLPGLHRTQMSSELRKLYLFEKGNPAAERLTPRKRIEILIQILEGLEPREAEVIIGIFNKDLGVKGLNYKFVKEAFPNLLP